MSLFLLLAVHIVCLFRYVCVFPLFTLLLFIRGSIFVFDFILFFFYQCFPNYISNNNNNTFNNFFSIICKWTTFASKDECYRQSCDVSAMLDVVVLLYNPSTLWKQTYSLLTDANGHVSAPPMTAQSELSNGTEPDSHRTSSVKLSNLFTLFVFC